MPGGKVHLTNSISKPAATLASRSAGGVSAQRRCGAIQKSPGRPGVGSVVRVAYAGSDGIYQDRISRAAFLETVNLC